MSLPPDSGESAAPDASVAALGDVKARIAEAAARVGRDAADVTLIAVSKTFGPEAIAAVIAAGQRVFGENRVQESKGKWPALKAAHQGIALHLIGPLQTNKAAEAVAMFDCIQTLDRPKLARVLADEMARQSRAPELFVEINTGGEAQKAGIASRDADAFITACRKEYGLTVAGLMCIPPAGDDPTLHFTLLARIAGRNGLTKLSMGMSGDFEIAVACGATHVRVGSAIFGDRRIRMA
ncbi:YggS family pyridoxal phosphate-dependent enzyme [soil metagenome]